MTYWHKIESLWRKDAVKKSCHRFMAVLLNATESTEKYKKHIFHNFPFATGMPCFISLQQRFVL
jgi:hypothetical protein